MFSKGFEVIVLPESVELTVLDTSFCAGEPVIVIVAGDDLITWYADPGMTVILGTGDSLVMPGVVSHTTVWVQQEVGSWSSGLVQVNIGVYDVPVSPILVGDTSVCEGSVLQLTTVPQPGVTEVWWYGPNGAYGGDTVVIDPVGLDDQGTWFVFVGNPGCVAPPTYFNVGIVDAAVMDIGPDTVICAGGTAVFQVPIRTFLLDMVPRDTPATAPRAARNALALGALQQLLKAKPAAYTDPSHAARITPGNLEDDLERACAASDLVIEAVVERLDIKQALFTRVAAAAGPHVILTSNTSGLGIGAIAEGLPEAARARLVGLHFFNPPRYMHLLEVVPSRHSDPAIVDELATFSDRVLGKGVVLCRDTPNFIGNRVGTAEMLLTFTTTAAGDYTVEEVDLLNGPLMGRPRTASYRLGDLVGIDVVGHVIRNLAAVLSGDPASPDFDELHSLMVVPPMIASMIHRSSEWTCW